MGTVRHKILSNSNTFTNMGVSSEFAKFAVLVAVSAHYALAQTTASSGVTVGATQAPNVTSGSTGDAWYDNPITMAVIIILCNIAVVLTAGPLLITSYRKVQATY